MFGPQDLRAAHAHNVADMWAHKLMCDERAVFGDCGASGRVGSADLLCVYLGRVSQLCFHICTECARAVFILLL